MALMTESKKIRLLLTGGGTGGHLFPAVAAAQEFQKAACRELGSSFYWYQKKDGYQESVMLTVLPVRVSDCYGLKGKSPLELLKALAVLPVSYLQALVIIRRFKPDIIVGVGGYVTGPVVAAAKSLGLPVVLHEQNSVPGLANRKLGRLADRICLSLPGSGAEFAGGENSSIPEIRYAAKFLQLAGKPLPPNSGRTNPADPGRKPGGSGG